MPSREFLLWVREASYGVPVTTPVLGTDAFFLRLSEPFAVADEPQIGYIPYGGGRSTRAEAFSDVTLVRGTLRTILFPAQSILLDWCATPVNAGRTAPWITIDPDEVMPPGDLASASLYHAYQLPNGTYVRKRYAGCKVGQWKLAFGPDGDARKGMLDITVVGQKIIGNAFDGSADPDATEFPAPTETQYPSGPFLLSHVRSGTGSLKLGTVRTQVAGFSVGATNKLDPRNYTGRWLEMCRFTGRDAQFEADVRLRASVDDKEAQRALTAQDVEVVLDAGGAGKTLKIDFHGRNVIGGHARDFPLDKEYHTKLTLENLWDPAQATDLTITRS